MECGCFRDKFCRRFANPRVQHRARSTHITQQPCAAASPKPPPRKLGSPQARNGSPRLSRQQRGGGHGRRRHGHRVAYGASDTTAGSRVRWSAARSDALSAIAEQDVVHCEQSEPCLLKVCLESGAKILRLLPRVGQTIVELLKMECVVDPLTSCFRRHREQVNVIDCHEISTLIAS